MEKLTHITLVSKDINSWGDLQHGQMSKVEGSSNLWMVCCPLCGNLGELRTHQVIENADSTVTVSPSLVCNGSIYKAPRTYERCTAHYFIDHNQIRWA